MLLKKIVRLLSIIVHVVRGGVQVFFTIDEKKGIRDKDQAMIQRWFECFLQKLNIEKRVHGKIVSGNHLMVANHISWIDIIVLHSIYATHFVAKSEIKKWPLVGWLSAKVGTLFVRRGSMTDARKLNEQIAQLLISGHCITLFPEGATSDGTEISKFYPGLFQAALDAQALDSNIDIVIQPVVIIYQVNNNHSHHLPYIGDASLWKNFWKVLSLESITVDVHFTSPIHAKNISRKELSEQSYQQMQKILHNNLKNC